MEKITEKTLIGDLLKFKNAEAIAQVLYGLGMHCFGCAIAQGETVGEAAQVHNIEVSELITSLNEAANS